MKPNAKKPLLARILLPWATASAVWLAWLAASNNPPVGGQKTWTPPSETEQATAQRLIKATLKNDLEAIVVLVEGEEPNVNARDKKGRSALFHAARDGRTEAAKALLEHGADAYLTNNTAGVNALHMASLKGHLETVRMLVRWGIYVDQRSTNGTTPLLYAIRNRQLKVADFLLEEGADIDAQTKQNQVALHIAVGTGSVEVVRWVLNKTGQSQVRREDWPEGRTPLDLALLKGRQGIVHLLLKEGGVTFENIDRNNALMQNALKGGEIGLVRLLMEKGVFFDFTTDDGKTALHIATEARASKDLVELLLNNGLWNRVNEPNAAGEVALHHALLYGKHGLVELLLGAGADLRLVGLMKGIPALHYSVLRRRTDVVRILAFHKDIDVNLKDRYGMTPMDYAENLLNHPSHRRWAKALVTMLQQAQSKVGGK